MHKIGNIGIIANFVFPHICSSLLYLQHILLVVMKLDISGCNSITFQGCGLHWSSSFLMAQLNKVGNIGILVSCGVCEKPYYQIVLNTFCKHIFCHNKLAMILKSSLRYDDILQPKMHFAIAIVIMFAGISTSLIQVGNG